LLDSSEGAALLQKLKMNIEALKNQLKEKGFQLAAESSHPIQPVLIGDSLQTKALVKKMFERGFLISSINYPWYPRAEMKSAFS
jgi:glycine C-acetyltransferase